MSYSSSNAHNSNPVNSTTSSRPEQVFGLKNILELIWRLRLWIVVFAAAALMVGFLYVRMQTPVYQRSVTMMLNNPGGQSDMSILSEISGVSTSKKIDNEIVILQSTPIMQKVVDKLELNARYYHFVLPVFDRLKSNRGLLAFKKYEYYKDSPFSLSFIVNPLYPEEFHPSSFILRFKNYDSKEYKIESLTADGAEQSFEDRRYSYGETVKMAGFSFCISLDASGSMIDRDIYQCTWNSSYSLAKSFVSKLSTNIQNPVKSHQSDVIQVSLTDTKPSRADDILNTLFLTVNSEAHEYNSVTSLNTVAFIDQRLETIAQELNSAENDYRSFQTSNSVVDLGVQSSLSIQVDREYQGQLNEVNLQLQLLDMVSQVLKDIEPGKFKVFPSNIGVSDVGLNAIIANYNSMVADRNRMVANSSEKNPRVLSLNTQLNDQLRSIEMSIENLVNMYNIRRKELSREVTQGKSRMAVIPRQQFEMQQLNRRLEVIEPLYQLLQQKREEAQIAMCSEADDFRLIEPANGPAAPISPKQLRILLICLLVGCCCPLAYTWLRMQLRTTVETKKDITDRIDANVLTTIPRSRNLDGELIKRDSRDAVAESFRNLRSNLQYLNDVKVIQVTSSIPGEGKTFVAANLALSIAHVGKKVLLVGLDIRKPRLSKIFNIDEVDKNNTVVGYLIGKCDDISKLVNHTGENHHLDVIFAGPVPPNPTELLSQGKLADILDFYRDKYDYIIVDSAPYLPVSDSFLINSYVDATIYTLRMNHTPLAMLDDINNAIHSSVKPMKRVSLVLNDLDYSLAKYRYGYGDGYGYGYGYRRGYGYGYGSGYGYGYGYGYGTDADGEDGKTKLGGHRRHRHHKKTEAVSSETETKS